jgi:hypothetical protein
VYLGRKFLDAFQITSGLGKRYWLLHIDGVDEDSRLSSPAAWSADLASLSHLESTIEMKRWGEEFLAQHPNLKDARHYLIHYYSPSHVLAGDVSIDCAGPSGRRYCAPGPFPHFAGIAIRYDLSQFELPVPDVVSSDPTTEPGAVLQFDQRLREWLVRLENPS